MSKKVIGGVLLALVGMGGFLAVPVFIASMFASMAAAQNPCISSIGMVAPAGGPVRLPVTGSYQVMSEYGMRYNPGQYNHGEYRLHAGLDFAQTPGPGPIVAAMAGVVSSLPNDPTGGGMMVVVDHGGGLTTTYKHLATRTVTVGDQVWAGRQLGVEGSTGNSTGAHLHFQVELNGEPINPRDWLTQQGVDVPALRGSGTAPGVVEGPGGTVVPAPASAAPRNPGTNPELTLAVASTLPAQVGPYKGKQIQIAALIIKAGQGRGLDAKTITTGVMTGMGESSLTNVAHGDAVRGDTIGVFQIGPEHGAYNDRMDPTWAAGNFFTRLLAVPGYQSLDPSVAAHKAQRNADPYHYTPYWADAVLMVSTLTKDPALLAQLPATGAVTGCENGAPPAPPTGGDGSGADIAAAATHYTGTPYSWGGGDIHGPSTGIYTSGSLDGTHTVGFDCSGLVIFAVYHSTGIQLDHSSNAQATDPRGQAVSRDLALMRPGDVIAFSEDGSGGPGTFGHIGVYLGGSKMVHAPRPGKTVQVVDVSTDYWTSMAWSVRRFANT